MYGYYLCRKAKCLELIILYHHIIFRIYINSTSDRMNCMLCQSLTTKLVTFCSINLYRVRKRLTSSNSKPEWQNKILVGTFDVLLWLIDQCLRRLCLFARSLFGNILELKHPERCIPVPTIFFTTEPFPFNKEMSFSTNNFVLQYFLFILIVTLRVRNSFGSCFSFINRCAIASISSSSSGRGSNLFRGRISGLLNNFRSSAWAADLSSVLSSQCLRLYVFVLIVGNDIVWT